MVHLGLPDSDALTVARLMAEADLQGSDGHGVSRLPQYARRIKAGAFNVRPNTAKKSASIERSFSFINSPLFAMNSSARARSLLE